MPIFEYRGVDASSKKVSGTIDADSERGARSKLRKQKIYPTKIVSTSGSSLFKSSRLFKGIKLADIAAMTRQMAVLLNANIPLIDSLASVRDQVENPKIRKALSEIKEKVSEGSRLWECLQTYPDIFDNIFIAMVKAGESAGSLDLTFERLANYKEKQAELLAKIRGAMIYPVIMFVVAVGIMILLFTFVMPQIIELFAKQKKALPLPTEIIITFTQNFNTYWYVYLVLFILGIFVFRKWRQSPKGREKFDAYKLKARIFGTLNQKIAVARLARTLETLLKSGVQLLQGLDIVKNVMDNVVLAQVIEKTIVGVREGEPLVEPLKRSKKFPALFLQMIAIGEKTGMLEAMLEKVAQTYDREVDQAINDMLKLLGPLILVFLGILVLIIVFSVIMPILEI